MYEAFYHLRAKPFQLSPDPSFFYGSKGHKRAMSYLEYGLHQGEGFIVITGEVGAGKTTLVRNLFKKLQGENVVAAQLVSTQLDADDMLRMIAAAFGLPHEENNKATLLKRLENFLLNCQNLGKRALLIVDEAQNLSPRAVEELRMLSNFQSQEKSLLQSFLLGQPEFRYTMASEGMQQLRQRVTASYHLGPMDRQETREYIEHRMRTVGWNHDPNFTNDAFAGIYDYAAGIPRKINTLCDRLLLMGYLEEMHQIDAAAVHEVVAEIKNEMAVPSTDPSGLSSVPYAVSSPVVQVKQLELESNLVSLEKRIGQVERSVVTMLKLMREVLSVAGLKRFRTDPHPNDKVVAIKE
ncbi:MAG: XrtA/PEP-CTERM system-associated ATPase [Burkholderiales bacterium]|nr:XrtA-associated ATPase [Pseudomonadota bacterium]